MYCRYCGKELPAGAKFCAACGGKQEIKPERQAKELFYLLIAITLLFHIFCFWAISDTFENLILNILTAAVGVGILLMMVKSKKIDMHCFKVADVVIWGAWLFLPRLLIYFIPHTLWGLYPEVNDAFIMVVSFVNLEAAEMLFGQLNGLWFWIELAVLCLARSRALKDIKKFVILAALILIVWSGLLILLQPEPLLHLITTAPNILYYTRESFALLSVLLWLRRGVELLFVLLYGETKLPPNMAMIFSISLGPLVVLMMLVLTSVFDLEILSFALAPILAYLIGGFALLKMRSWKTGREA